LVTEYIDHSYNQCIQPLIILITSDNQYGNAAKPAEHPPGRFNPFLARSPAYLPPRVVVPLATLVTRGQIKIEYVSTDKMITDGLTKPLADLIFEKYVFLLGLQMSGGTPS
jgi:hypothetical protein